MRLNGLSELVAHVLNTRDVNPNGVRLYNGVSKIAHAMYIVKNDNEILSQGYGYKNLIKYLLTTSEDGFVVKFIGMTDSQLECCEFSVEEKGEEEVITLKTPVGSRDIGSQEVVVEDKAEIPKTEEVVDEEAVEDQDESQESEVDAGAKTEQELGVDWEHAESLTKKELDKYASTFGVSLDGRKSKAKMLESFKSQME